MTDQNGRRLAVLGTGQVGQAIARRAAEVGYQVTVGARSADSSSLSAFADDEGISTGSFSDAVRAADLVVNATHGQASLAVLQSVGPEALGDKVLLDASNELVPVDGGFPVPAASPDNSLALRLQQAFPELRVVKSLNTMTNRVMVRPDLIAGDHVVFLSGDDPAAKDAVRALLYDFGWRPAQMVDLGGIDSAASVEMMMSAWMRVMLARGRGAPPFNWAILSAEQTPS